MINAGIVGAAGYTGVELLKLLTGHREVNVAMVTSDTFCGQKVAEAFPRFAHMQSLEFEDHESALNTDGLNAVFLCLPHGESMKYVPALRASGLQVFDLSADFRLEDISEYEKWYSARHTAAEYSKQAVYGLPELNKELVADADLVAVPGCYPTSAILGLAPVIGADWIDPDSIVINSVSGVTGAGRKASIPLMYAELDDDFHAYGAPDHRHTPEIEQELSKLAGKRICVTFIPHLAPVARGIYTTITIKMTEPRPVETVIDQLRDFYRDSLFVSVFDAYPHMKWTLDTNNVMIGAHVDRRSQTLLITSTLDNLVKGASGQAVQCFNIRRGFDEAEGLR